MKIEPNTVLYNVRITCTYTSFSGSEDMRRPTMENAILSLIPIVSGDYKNNYDFKKHAQHKASD